MSLGSSRLPLFLMLTLGVGSFAALRPVPAIAADTPYAQSPPQRGIPPGFPDLVGALKATPGCLGVETARTQSGKQVIFAWFENKEAVLRWYNNDVHRKAQDRFFPNRPPHTPLADVPDDVGPVLAVASLTISDSTQFANTKLPVSQIAIELYKPLPGGVFLGSRFAPMSMSVPGMLDYTPKAKSKSK